MTEERFSSRITENCMVLEVRGMLIENDNYEDLRLFVDQSIREGQRKFVIDLGNLRLINSSGINLLVGIIKRINEHDGQVVFTRVPDKVTELLNIIRLNAMLSLKNSIDEGIQSLN